MKALIVWFNTGLLTLMLILSSAASWADDQVEPAKININTATAEELDALKGIGKAKAEAIVAYREEFGAFQSLEELTAVKGIGAATLEQNLPLLTLE